MEMLAIPKNRQEKIAFWKGHYDAFQQSDLNITAFCRSRGIFMQSFRKWIDHFGSSMDSDN